MTIFSGRWLIACLCFSVAATAILLRHAHERLALTRPEALLYGALAIAAAALLWVLRAPRAPWQRSLRDGVESVAAFTLICVTGAVASYPEAAASVGYVDPALQRIDRAFGFGWIAWYDVVAAHPLLQRAGAVAYQSIFVTPAAILIAFAATGRVADARRFLAAFWLAAVATLILFERLPALGPLVTLLHGPLRYVPTSAAYQAALIPALRRHAAVAIDPGRLHGLVCAPSFHAASALLYVAAAWPVRRLRVPVLLVDAAMLLATPVEGTHYLADILLGLAVAAASIAAVRLAERLSLMEARRGWHSAAPAPSRP